MSITNKDHSKGMIGWMTSHPVTANLIMIVLIIGGLISMATIKQEVFPEFELDQVSISVSYPGATPEEVEKGITRVIEEQLQDVEDIKEITSVSGEGSCSVNVELEQGVNNNKVFQDIKVAIDRITSFPEKAEDPKVSLVSRKSRVLTLMVYGQLSEHVLKEVAERLRLRLLDTDKITQVEIAGVRNPEIAVEVPVVELRRYGLTLSDIASKIESASLEMGGGTVKTDAGEVLLKIDERRDYASEFAQIPLVATKDGAYLTVGDIANVSDGFEDSDRASYYNGLPAVQVQVYRIGDQTPKGISAEVHEVLADWSHSLPESVKVGVWSDRSDVLQERIDLLMKNIWMGLIIVMIVLGCFLQVRLAFWVMMGIPISFLGSFVFLPVYDVSINMISLFAFITSLGMVVDDAIVVGENVFQFRERGHSYVDAAIKGAKQVAVPVTFSILTNIVAFAPLMFVPGYMGKIFKTIPIVVISVFIISLFEALFILPAHLAHQKVASPDSFWTKFNRIELWFGGKLKIFINKLYRPVLKWSIRQRYITMAISLAVLIVTFGFYMGGHVSLIFFPNAASDIAMASIELPYGSPFEETRIVHDRLVNAAKLVAKEYEEKTGKQILRGIYSGIGYAGRRRGGGTAVAGAHTTSVEVFLVPTDERSMSTESFRDKWREYTGKIKGAQREVFLDDPHGPSGGDPINIRLAHSDIETLEKAANDLAEILSGYSGVKDIDNGFSQGKPEYDFKLTPAARSLGFTSSLIASQIRNAYYGAEALRQQRNRDEIKVMVRLPRDERESLNDLEQLVLHTPTGGEVVLSDIVDITKTRASTSIIRIDGRRQISVAGDIVPKTAAGKVVSEVLEKYQPVLTSKYPGLRMSVGGERKDMDESLTALLIGCILSILVIYALLAIPFNSYLQPIIIMVSIPFGIIGAVAGHLIMGYDYLCITSFMGIVALCGVVVNDSLVLVDLANSLRVTDDMGPEVCVFRAGIRRFRPIMLTSVTTFGGLAPMIFETSRQATFMIPMALSLGYGILFATVIALLLVPALYCVVEDVKKVTSKFWNWKIF